MGSRQHSFKFILLLLAPICLCAQTPPQIPPGGQIQLQVAQPPVDNSSPVTATAGFDPPVVRAGEKTYYRVNVDAPESAVQWPAEISAPVELKFGAHARGQLTQLQGGKFRPLVSFVYEVSAVATGHFTVAGFSVKVAGVPVEIPAVSLDAVADNPALPAARQLLLDISATNVFLGQPFRVRVLLPASPANETEALREIQLIGDGLMVDKTASHQSIEVVNVNGQPRPAFIAEMKVTPIAPGPLRFTAQGFTAGREFIGPISIRGQVSLPGGPAKYVLLVSDPVAISVLPLPVAGELPGFTGAIGKFSHDPPQLATNRLRVGEPVQLKVVFHGEGDLTRLVPPLPPRSREWQIVADPPPATGFTLIPLSDEVHETPAIPFSYFDPALARYVDLTIPPLPVTVAGVGLPVQLPALGDEIKSAAPLKLSGFAPTPGKTVASLKPLQLHGWFVAVQLLPVAGFLALGQWNRRRRFLAAHPEVVRCRQARRDLRRERINIQGAVAAGDAVGFVRHAASAMRIAVAPHFPAQPQALVCGDVLSQFDAAERGGPAGETVRKIFAAADAQYSDAPPGRPDLSSLPADVQIVLGKLEAKL